MSSDRIAQVEDIAELCRVLLHEIRSGHLADFSRFGQRFDALFNEMKSLDTSPVEDALQIEYRRALRDLERVRLQLLERLNSIGKRYPVTSSYGKGPWGLEEYRKSLEDPHRGTKRAK